MTFKKFIESMLTDSEGAGISTKRVVGILAFIVFTSLAYINTFAGKLTPNTFIDSLMWIIIAAFFGSTMEYFSKNRGPQAVIKAEDDAKIEVNTSTGATTNNPKAAVKQSLVGDAAHDVTPNEIIG